MMLSKDRRPVALGFRMKILLNLGICILSAACTLSPDSGVSVGEEDGQGWQERGEVRLEVQDGMSPLDIVRRGFSTWLEQYTQPQAPPEVALAEFRIASMEAVSDPFFGNDYTFVFRVEYEVLAENPGSIHWLAGDGREGQGGWVVGKIHYVGVIISGGQARILILGPCPMC